MVYKRFLILDSNGDGRVIARLNRRLRSNEVAFRLNVKVPDAWARISDAQISVELPPPPDAPSLEVVAGVS